MKPIISVEGLGKKYVIRHEGQTHYKSLREEIFQLPKKLIRRQENKEEFWALKDVNFDIMPGDRVGIIGRNGAGKSTLLKLLSRITEPSVGRITMRGRVASLLEVGTGFHPELTGRENIYLNGAIFGMSRVEVRRKFDEIVEFSGVEKFLNTPVKRYSSGMYVRLAFAVAAHLEPEILIVDEVLAVGDAEFQTKCLGKMEEVSKGQGRTVMFVSHNIAMITKFCTSGIWLQSGECFFSGSMQDAIDGYRSLTLNIKKNVEKTIVDPHQVQFLSVYMTDELENQKNEYEHTESVCISLKLQVPIHLNGIEVAISLYDHNKVRVFTIHEQLDKFSFKNNVASLKFVFLKGFIVPGIYSWIMCILNHGGQMYDLQDDVCAFKVIDVGSDFARYAPGSYGSVRPIYTIL